MSDQVTDPTTNAAAGVNPKRRRAPGAGRPRKSGALHRLHGTRSRARAKKTASPPSAVARELLVPPADMPEHGRAFWRRNAPRLARCGRLRMQHLSAWDAMCRRYAAYRRAERAVNRMCVTDEHFAAVSSVAARAYGQYASASARFGLDTLADAIVSARDGSSVDTETNAPELPATSTAIDPAEQWERDFGRGG